MTKLDIIDNGGKVSGSVQVSDRIFLAPLNENLVNETLNWYLASQRPGNASAKTRAEVAGSGRKPWKQKGTGRARIGDIRPPHWRKGGVAFPPKPRDYSFSLPIKVRKAALRIVLSDKFKNGKIKVIEKIALTNPKTQEMIGFLEAIGSKGSALIVTAVKDELVNRVSANIRNVSVSHGKALNVFELLKHDDIVILKDALPVIEEALK